MEDVRISVVIPTFKREKELRERIIYWTNELIGISYKIVIANSSDLEEFKAEFQKDSNLKFLDLSDNCWWTDSVNSGIAYAKNIGTSFIIITNDDMDYPPGLFRVFARNADKYPNTILTIPQKSISEKIYYGAYLSKLFYDFIPLQSLKEDTYIEITNGSCLFLPVNILNSIGSFNDDAFPHYNADIEFMLRCKKNSIKLVILNTKALVQGPPTSFIKRFSLLNIYYHKGSPYYYKAFLHLGKVLFGNYFNMFFGRGIKYSGSYFLGVLFFQVKKIMYTVKKMS